MKTPKLAALMLSTALAVPGAQAVGGDGPAQLDLLIHRDSGVPMASARVQVEGDLPMYGQLSWSVNGQDWDRRDFALDRSALITELELLPQLPAVVCATLSGSVEAVPGSWIDVQEESCASYLPSRYDPRLAPSAPALVDFERERRLVSPRERSILDTRRPSR